MFQQDTLESHKQRGIHHLDRIVHKELSALTCGALLPVFTTLLILAATIICLPVTAVSALVKCILPNRVLLDQVPAIQLVQVQRPHVIQGDLFIPDLDRSAKQPHHVAHHTRLHHRHPAARMQA
ncbi:hypothetical protein DUNSADRAFT_13568 [Dunaliella salina]|uniref:Encoded protein n=1 Tax=Dunaliella salina TaxID=3046 RepID=A0ABQ7H3A0_DUNSA|nr:hypothetical protein DUNSADRAFT_13568 [Dunaliella salina]|eukprot:KAF5841295.1 hypothetical protein DUNSADRAFT_13568 [Dunaliella salina]